MGRKAYAKGDFGTVDDDKGTVGVWKGTVDGVRTTVRACAVGTFGQVGVRPGHARPDGILQYCVVRQCLCGHRSAHSLAISS
ncbi:hypothetical protein DFR67_111230 [Williamsia limnetica]|uniref:Uncharacterized protein n=1 Tax=Williamsia limnetica TaxID=882452 RepID=A0A318RLK2_WILLI|nr:hypothetical protein DFR67_111230 [Williamsia limnetica]